MQRPWIGRAIAAVGVIHTLFGVVAFRSAFAALAAEGLWNTVHGQLERELPVWFVVSGLLLVIFGGVVHVTERLRLPLPWPLWWSFLATTVALVFVMPLSGCWLLLPPAVAGVWRRRQMSPEAAA